MDERQHQLALECKRQHDSCLYTSTSLFIWLRTLRWIRGLFIVLPLIFSSIAGWKLLATSDRQGVKVIAAICAMLAGLLPAIYAGLKYDDQLGHSKQLAGEFKNLQDRFRQAALVSSYKPLEEFEAEFKKIRERMEAARSHSYTAPEWCFRMAQKKIDVGDYSFDVDGNE